MSSFITGQRWHSLSEPELGLGSIAHVEGREVVISFPARDTLRRYSTDEAPLARGRLSPGQVARSLKGESFVIEGVDEQDGLLIYRGEGHVLPEAQLDGSMDVGRPENRLRMGQADAPADFLLRQEALSVRHRMLSSPARGFFGGRIRLFDHQLSIAQQVCERYRVRVLLADEVGLGKTIEALLILHRMLLTGRVKRSLVIVPPALVHQWLAEAYLRFHMVLRVIGRDTVGCEDLEGPEAPPSWSDAQMFICPLDYQGRAELGEGDWDLVIVDEAHHLELNSEAFQAVAGLTQRVPHVVMLSATPDRDGEAAHFQRLALLDPERFTDAEAYKRETRNYQPLANAAERLQTGLELEGPDLALLKERLTDFDPKELGQTEGRQRLLRQLLDLHGLGRVMFRNVRAKIPGFPKRCFFPVDLAGGDPKRLEQEFLRDIAEFREDSMPNLRGDPRLAWLREFVASNPDERVLVLCTDRPKVEAFAKALENSKCKVARFHEGMSSLERDRQAAWWLAEDGPRVLLSSAIGAEGRNFQAARNLVLLDLPLSPDRLEQAIGRIDRIGQGSEVRIFVPCLPKTPQARLRRWFDEALQIFDRSWHGSPNIQREFGTRLLEALHAPDDQAIDGLIAEASARNSETLAELEQGRDRLLELTSFDPRAAEDLAHHIEQAEIGPELERFFLSAFERAGLDIEVIGTRSYLVRTGIAIHRPIPGFSSSEMAFTFDRQSGLDHPERVLLTWDHPMLRDLIDDTLSHELGNVAVAQAHGQQSGILLMALFVVEAAQVARADRFLPPTPLEIFVDVQGSEYVPPKPLELQATNSPLLQHPPLLERVPLLIDRARSLANARADAISQQACQNLEAELHPAIHRLEELGNTSPSARALANDAKADFKSLYEALQAPRVRLDALAVILVSPKA